MIFTSNFVIDFMIISIILSIFIYLFATRRYNHWKKKGVPFIKPVPIFGNVLDVFTLKQCIGELLKKIYEETSKPYIGLFVCDEPCLLIRDPELVKSVLVKDFAYFNNRTVTENKKDDPIGAHTLLILKNPEWKEMRKKITPVLTSGKIKLMYKLILESGEDLVRYLHQQVENNSIVETREVCAKYTTDTITSTSFGINANCFKDENAEFRQVSRRVFNCNSFERGFSTMCYFIAPALVKLFGLRFIDKTSSDFLRDAFWKTMNEREQSNFVRDDLLDILIQMKREEQANQNEDIHKLEGDKLVALAATFFLAGFETSSSTISFTLYELARHQGIQEKLRQEILKFKTKHGNVSYEALQEMEYLDMCIKETLRMYPSLPFLDRRCTKDYVLPGTDITIEQGTPVFISNMGMQYDPEYFPDPDRYEPERFTPENMTQRPFYAYLPFGEGPRNCIGTRFGMLNSKCGVAQILSEFEVEMCDETPKKMKFFPTGFTLAPVNGLRLRFRRLAK